jgi:predicted enzyme related to lactoylglutathione lyase
MSPSVNEASASFAQATGLSYPADVETERVINVQRTDFVAVPTRDRRRAVDFYEHTLGLMRNPNSTDTWIEFETGNLTLSIVVPEEVGIEFAPLPFGTIMLRVPDVAAAKAKLQAVGVEFLGETWDSGVCHGAVFLDPDGNSLGLHHRYSPYPDGRLP